MDNGNQEMRRGLERNEWHRFTLKLRNVSLTYLAYVVIRDIFVPMAHTCCLQDSDTVGARMLDEIFEFALKRICNVTRVIIAAAITLYYSPVIKKLNY